MPLQALSRHLVAIMIGSTAGAASASTYSEPGHQVKVDLNVDATGKIGECTIITSSDQPDQDPLACFLLQQRATASLDRAHPVKIRTSMRWLGNSADSDILLQPDDPRLVLAPRKGSNWLNVADYPDELLHGASVATTVVFTVLPNGRPVSCNGDGKSGNRALESWGCRIIESRRLFPRGQTPQGEVLSYRSSVRFFWTPRAIRACDFADACWKLKQWTPQ